MSISSPETLIDDIYQAALVPEKWPDVLGRLSKIIDGAGGLLFTTRLDRIKWTASPDIHALFEEFLRDGWAAINRRPAQIARLNYAGFIRDNDHFTPEELDNDPVYRDFYRKRGIGWATGTILDVPSGDSIIFSFERAFDKGPVPAEFLPFFDGLRPHLARAALLASRFGLERAQTMTGALEALGLPGAVLRGQGALFAANPSFEKLIPTVAYDRRDRLHLNEDAADKLLGHALARFALQGGGAAVSSIPVPAREGSPPLILHLVPIRGEAHDVFTQATSLLVVTPVDRAIVPDAQLLRGLFDLTPAEARVAYGIGDGQTIEAIAAAFGLSRETIRSQLKGVLAKTGVRRQTQLVGLLTGTMPRLASP